MKTRVLVLGGRDPMPRRASLAKLPRQYGDAPEYRVGGETIGWHLSQLQAAADRLGVTLEYADYESLSSNFADQRTGLTVVCDHVGDESREVAGSRITALTDFDAILTRTMPAGSLEQITFRLSVLHAEYQRRLKAGTDSTFINPPSGLEWAIDKYATLEKASRLGIPVPPTIVTQNRADAMRAFDQLGGDVVVKPIFGGEGRGVMRIRDRELAWTTFATLQQLGCVAYVQRFCSPGGGDVRLLVIGESVHAIRRTNTNDFRTNVRSGGISERIELRDDWSKVARRVCDSFGLTFAAVDLIETNSQCGCELMEVNAIPGWRSAQTVVDANIAEQIISVLKDKANAQAEANPELKDT